MVIRKFLYEKADGNRKNYEIFLIRERNGYFEGLSTENMSPEEIVKVAEIYKEFEAKIEAYSKGNWRKFSSANVIEMEDVINKK